jgi:protein-lysine N-methyltransferase EEF2KMT
MTVARLIMEQQESEHDKMRSVLLTDGDDQAVRLLQQNLSNPYNGFLNHGDTCDIGACKLRWGNESDYADLRKRRRRIDFDCIVAGDVLYKTELPPLFFQTVDVFLSREKKTDFVPVLYLCHVPRASVTHEVVQEAARAAGFDIETITGGFPSSMISAGCPLDDSSRARVYRITRCPHGT